MSSCKKGYLMIELNIKLKLDSYQQYIAFLDNCLINLNGITVNGQDITEIYRQLAMEVQRDHHKISKLGYISGDN